MRGHGGVTLVETLVAVTILGIVLTAAMGYWHSGMKRGARLDTQVMGASAASQLMALMDDDLIHLVPGKRSTVDPTAPPAQSVSLLRVAGARTIRTDNLPLDANLAPIAERVDYVFEPTSGRVLRNGMPLPLGPFLDVRFAYRAASAATGTTFHLKVVMAGEPAATGHARRDAEYAFDRHCVAATSGHAREEWVF